MEFNTLFRKVSISNSFLSKIENRICSYDAPDTSQYYSRHTQYFDEDREFLVWEGLCDLKKRVKQGQRFQFLYGYNQNRRLSPEKLLNHFKDTIFINSPKLSQALFNKNLELFFKMILLNDYSFVFYHDEQTDYCWKIELPLDISEKVPKSYQIYI